jgi:membrane associated rhomboid family serine protease
MSSLLAKARDKVSRHQDERRTRRSNSSNNDEEYGDPIELPASTNNRTATTSDYQLEINAADNNAALLLNNKKNKQRTWSFRGDPEEAHYIQHYAPFSTLFVVAQCIILTLMMIKCGVAPLQINPMIGPGPDVLDYWGAKNAYKILENGETYRLFTPVFLHAGIIHLLGNVMVQIDAGNTWEKEWGSLIWLLVYIGSTLGSSIFSCCFMPDNISVGSSGAVMGLFGAKFAEIALLCCEKGKTRQERWANTMRNRQACQVIGGIILVMAMSFIPFVDWAAHVGGVIAGFVFGIVCFSFQLGRRDSIVSWVFVALWFIVGLGGVIAYYVMMLVYMYTEVEANPDLKDVCAYYQQFFENYECTCQIGG